MRPNATAKIAFFDGIADKWDGWEDLDSLPLKLKEALEELGLGPNESVVDVGCGTGNLTKAVLAKLSTKGHVTAVDFSPAMIAAAQKKISDPRVTWHAADVHHLPIADGAADRVICYSVWPHFDDPAVCARELIRILRPGGVLHVWHLASRETINEIHANAGDAVAPDVLHPAEETAALLSEEGMVIKEVIDDDRRYLVTAIKTSTAG